MTITAASTTFGIAHRYFSSIISTLMECRSFVSASSRASLGFALAYRLLGLLTVGCVMIDFEHDVIAVQLHPAVDDDFAAIQTWRSSPDQ